MNGLNHKERILGIISVSLILFGLIHLSSFSYALNNPKDMIISFSFKMQEFTSLNGGFNDTSSINLNIPESDWSLSDISINFANIHQKNYTQVQTGGGSVYGFIKIIEGISGLGNEIQLENSINLSSVEIFCYTSVSISDQIYVQIQGYDPSTQLPTSTIYGTPVFLNVSTSPNWYIQTFSNPIYLPAGRYYLVINASQVEESTVIYYWKYGDSSVLRSAYYTTKWSITPIHCNFCYKLNQKRLYYNPIDLNMQVEIEGVKYNVLESKSFSSGILNVNNLNLSVKDISSSLQVYTNHSADIFFDYIYEISLNNYFLSNGTLTIKENLYNTWNITPNITRYGYNYCIRFKYPDDWNNIIIYKNGIDINSELLFEQDYCYIMNTTITDDSEWLITARSYLYDYEIDCFNDHIVQGEVLNVSVMVPNGNGIALLKVFNSQGTEIYNETKIITSEKTTFNYTIPSNIPAGIYYVYVFWQNNFEAGVQSFTFYVSDDENSNNQNSNNENWITDELLLIISLLSIILVAVGVVSSYLILKSKRSRKYTKLDIPTKNEIESIKLYEKIINHKFIDIFNLKSIIISEKLSGLYVYEETFQDVEFDALLVSGFIEAIKSFGKEVININTGNQILNIEYEGLNIYLVEVSCFNFILIMGMKPSNEFLLAIDNLVEEIDYRYGHSIENFYGDISKFEGIKELIEKYLELTLLCPFTFNSDLNYQFTSEEKSVLYKAYDIMKKTNQNHFHLSSLLSSANFGLKTAQIILKFIRQEIFKPLRT